MDKNLKLLQIDVEAEMEENEDLDKDDLLTPKIANVKRYTLAPHTISQVARASLMDLKFKLSPIDAELPRMTPQERKEFFMRPLPIGTFIQCVVKREKTGLTKLQRRFIFQTDSGVVLAASKKVGGISKKPYYLISIDPSDMSRDGVNYVGKVRWNVKGTEFTAYGSGDNFHAVLKSSPRSVRSATRVEAEDDHGIREQHLFVRYRVFRDEPVVIQFVVPHVDEDGKRTICKPTGLNDPGLGELVLSRSQNTTPPNTTPLVCEYVTPEAEWDDELDYHVQNFSERVKEPSVKNFLVVRPDQRPECHEKVYIQFGKVSADEFVLDFGHPFSPFQAFAMAISSLDYKFCMYLT